MKSEELFGKDLIKQLNKTHKLHSDFTTGNKELKKKFKANFNIKVLECIQCVIDDLGFDNEKELLDDFLNKVHAGNYDDNDVEDFKELVEPYMDQIMKKLKESGNFDGGGAA